MKKVARMALLLTLLFALFTFRLYKIDGTSMNYTLIEGDFVLCGKLFKKIERGDLLVIEHPLEQQDRLYIKRCAAVPGDRFFEKDRHFYLQIEGNATKTLQYALRYDLTAVRTKYGYFLRDPYMKYYCVAHNERLRVPKVLESLPVQRLKKDQYYLLGDYRDNSADSRFFGAVPRQWIRSKVLFVFKKAHSWQQLIEIKEADEANATHHEAGARHP